MSAAESHGEGVPEFIVRPNMEGTGYNAWRPDDSGESAPVARVVVTDQTSHRPPTTTFRVAGIGVFNGPPGYEQHSVGPVGEQVEVIAKQKLVSGEAARARIAGNVASLAFMLAEPE